MTILTKSSIESLTIELLEKQGYQYIYGPDIFDAVASARASIAANKINCVIIETLQSAINRLNPHIPEQQKTDFTTHARLLCFFLKIRRCPITLVDFVHSSAIFLAYKSALIELFSVRHQ